MPNTPVVPKQWMADLVERLDAEVPELHEMERRAGQAGFEELPDVPVLVTMAHYLAVLANFASIIADRRHMVELAKRNEALRAERDTPREG